VSLDKVADDFGKNTVSKFKIVLTGRIYQALGSLCMILFPVKPNL
jgi:hypothetical protein